MMTLRGCVCRPAARPDPWRQLLAAVVWRAVRDAWRGDDWAALWLTECCDWLTTWLDLPTDAFAQFERVR